MNKAFKLVLLASLILNVLLVGMIVGQLPQRFDRGASRQQRMENFIKSLPESVQGRFRNKLKDNVQTRDQVRAARDDAIRALAADPFDESVYDRRVHEVNKLRVQMTNRIAAEVKEIARDLPLEQRRALAKALKGSSRPAN